MRSGVDGAWRAFAQPRRYDGVSELPALLRVRRAVLPNVRDGDALRGSRLRVLLGTGKAGGVGLIAAGREQGRGVEGHARRRRNGTGRRNPAQGFLVRGQRQRESAGTLVAPILAGIKPGRPCSGPGCD